MSKFNHLTIDDKGDKVSIKLNGHEMIHVKAFSLYMDANSQPTAIFEVILDSIDATVNGGNVEIDHVNGLTDPMKQALIKWAVAEMKKGSTLPKSYSADQVAKKYKGASVYNDLAFNQSNVELLDEDI